MALPFDPDTVSHCEYLRNAQGIKAVEVVFKDGTSRIFEGDQITDELLAMCRSKKPPHV
jgi:hypothetical protein